MTLQLKTQIITLYTFVENRFNNVNNNDSISYIIIVKLATIIIKMIINRYSTNV